MASGIPLQQPRRAVNSNVRAMVDQTHQLRAFGTGSNDDMPYTSYGPSPPDGEAALPPGLVADPLALPKRPFLQEPSAIHQMQHASMQ